MKIYFTQKTSRNKKANLNSKKLFFALVAIFTFLTSNVVFAQTPVSSVKTNFNAAILETVKKPNDTIKAINNIGGTDTKLVNANKSTLAITCGNVYASGYSSGREILYELNGATMIPIFTAPQIVGGLAISANGNAYYDDGTFVGSPLYSSDGVTQTNTGAIVDLYVGEAADAIGNVFYIDNVYHLRENIFGAIGSSTDLGALVFDAGDVIGPTLAYGDMTFDGNGRLFWYASVSGFGKSYLYVIDTTTLKTSNLGNIGPDGATGLAFDIAGKLITTSNAGATVISVDLSSPSLEGTVIGTAEPSVFDLGSCVTPLFNPILAATKSVANITSGSNPATTAQAGDVLEYTIVVSNTGNLISNNSLFVDAIPVSTTYVPNSTMVNGIPVADVVGNMPFVSPALINSPSELPGIINVGSTSTITFRVTIDANNTGTVSNTATVNYPTTNGGVTTAQTVDSNTVIVSVLVFNPILTPTKSVANITTGANPALTAQAGDVLEYTIVVSNTGNAISNNSLFADAIPVSTTYVPNSTMVNGISVADVAGNMPFASPALINSPTELPGIINVGSTSTIIFRVTIDANNTGAISNTATVNYPTTNGGVTTVQTVDSNTVIVSVLVFNPILTPTKSVANITTGDNPALTAQAGDVLEYTIVVSNTGNAISNNSLFADAIPVSTTYVPNSTTINGIPIADIAGNMPFATPALINSPTELPGIINIGSTSTITFRVTIDANNTGTVSNTATVTYPTTNGGVATDSNTVVVSVPADILDIEIHDYLSPNGDRDEKNEIFIIEGIDNYPDNTVEIYNRWGVLVYDVFGYNNTDKSFNGISNGRLTVKKGEYLPEGTYFYVLRYKTQTGVTKEKVGYLFMNR
jgi:uncharacterized repeat protein (TIGR01451 family)/gliding motility-associated-like protein